MRSSLHVGGWDIRELYRDFKWCRFIESEDCAIDLGGESVHMSYLWPVPMDVRGGKIDVVRMSPNVRHAVNLSAKNGLSLRINN
ncbi:hypothetical protein GCM10009804_37200 [Kribbella hippodromi]|uniref:Uncharacterized protein n=1 Tax=Kribbella hippodromi TaxID=434347 RepID=A0ABP4PDI0_9ACTN